MKKTIISLLAIALAFNLSAQKPPIDHSVYDGWNRIGYIGVPYSKDWLTYQVMPQEGDATLYYLNLISGTSYSFERAAHAAITPDCKYALIKVSPAYAQVKELKRKKTKEDKMPKDTLLLLNLATGQTTSYPDVKDYKLPEKMERFVAFRLSQPHVVPAADTTAAVPDSLKAAKPIPDSLKAVTPKEGAEGAKAPKAAPDKKKEKPDESWKTDLLVLDILSGMVDTIKMVDSFYWVPDGSRIVYSRKPADKDTVYTRGLYVYTPADGASKDIVTTPNKKAYISSVSFSNKYKYMTFMAGLDTAKSAEKDYSAYVYDWNELREVISSKDSRIPEGFTLSKNRALSFDTNCTRAYFGLAPKLPEKDTTLRDDERGKLDIWTWNEEFLHSEQRFMAGKIKDLNYACHIPFDGKGDLVMLEEDGIQGVTPRVTNTHDYVLVTSNKPYRLQRQWNTEDRNDLYRICISDGSREKLMTEVPIRLVGSSPDGRWYVWYDFAKQCFFQYDIESGTSVDVTSAIDDIFFDDLHDTPSVAGPISGASWEADSKAYYIQSKYDVWKFDPTGKKAPVCVTQGKGKATRTVYRITADIFSKAHIDRDYRGYLQPGDPLWFQTFNEESKENGLATINMSLRKPQLQTLQQGPWTYSSMLGSRATKKPTFVSVRGNFESGNNLWIYRNMFASEEKITDINPQQADYRWGSVELVKWTTYNGHPAEGILYTPDDIDSTKKYPVIVYFYERMSQELYQPRNPAPSRSVINPAWFVSNGYCVFMPDIYYETGHPGKSAYDYILSGCDKICERPWIDGDNMAIQGQSWGGYQVAWLITQTDRFKAAGAGAPVSNMTSAYGGIRWGSGMVRQMQYEKEQSRIGTDLWSGLDLYIENSPIFFVPNVTTPVLIMHNDNDGAVPWWQGIEFFTALRRCGKQAWMLQYNGEAHNLNGRANSKDLSVRLGQFFGHFLKGEPMPYWMEHGIPYWEKDLRNF